MEKSGRLQNGFGYIKWEEKVDGIFRKVYFICHLKDIFMKYVGILLWT